MSSVTIWVISTARRSIDFFDKPDISPSYQTLLDIVQKFPTLNLNWLITGEGQMFHHTSLLSSAQLSDGQLSVFDGKEVDFIPLYDNIDTDDSHTKFWEREENVLDVIPKKFGMRDCDLAIHIYGNSMCPLHMPGDIILLKEVKDHTLVNYGRVYIVITEEHRFMKYALPAEDKTYLLLRSENKHYGDIEVKKIQIIKLYQVQGSFRRTGI